MTLKDAGRRCAEAFREIGERIEHEWRRYDFAEAALPDICASTLVEAAMHKRVTPRDIAAWVMTAETLGPQPNAGTDFGQPQLTLYAGRAMYIEVLQWLEATTAIHQHSFSGAFAVLGGSSLHTTYEFSERQRFGDHFLLGDVRWTGSEILREGFVRRIEPGRKFIHALFHLHEPSHTIVARSYRAPNVESQLSYMPPTVAMNPFESRLWIQRAMGYINGLPQAEVAGFVDAAMERASPAEAFDLLTTFTGPRFADTPVMNLSLAAASKRFGVAMPMVMEAIADRRLIEEIEDMRKRVRDPGERLFLALLMNVPNRERIVSLVAEHTQGADPVAQIDAWVRTLMNATSHRANVALGEDAMLVLTGMLRRKTLPELYAALEEVHGPLDDEDRVAVSATVQQLVRLPMLRALTRA